MYNFCKFWLVAILLFPQILVADTGFIVVEGFGIASKKMAKRVWKRIKQRNPRARVASVQMQLATRAAELDAERNAVEYVHGVKFSYRNNSLTTHSSNVAHRALDKSDRKVTQLPSGITMVSFQVAAPELSAKRQTLPVYTVRGVARGKNHANILMAQRSARLNAMQQAIHKAIYAKYGFVDAKTNFTGTVYIVATVSDRSRAPYSIVMQLQVDLE